MPLLTFLYGNASFLTVTAHQIGSKPNSRFHVTLNSLLGQPGLCGLCEPLFEDFMDCCPFLCGFF